MAQEDAALPAILSGGSTPGESAATAGEPQESFST